MAAQATKLSTIGDNIANSSTTGYKRSGVEFETLLGNEATSEYESGGVLSNIRYGITDQGTIASTTSGTDLAISGNGFFVVLMSLAIWASALNDGPADEFLEIIEDVTWVCSTLTDTLPSGSKRDASDNDGSDEAEDTPPRKKART